MMDPFPLPVIGYRQSLTDFCSMVCEGKSARGLLGKYFSHLRWGHHKRRSLLESLFSLCTLIVRELSHSYDSLFYCWALSVAQK